MKNLAQLQETAEKFTSGKVSRSTFLARLSRFLHSLTPEELREVAEHIAELPSEGGPLV